MPHSNGSLGMPSIASEGIHVMDVTDDSMRMALPRFARPGGGSTTNLTRNGGGVTHGADRRSEDAVRPQARGGAHDGGDRPDAARRARGEGERGRAQAAALAPRRGDAGADPQPAAGVLRAWPRGEDAAVPGDRGAAVRGAADARADHVRAA